MVDKGRKNGLNNETFNTFDLSYLNEIGDEPMFHRTINEERERERERETERERERERNVLFNDALNTFYLRLYGVRHMVKDHSDSEKGNPLSPHRLLLSINSKGSFICIIPQTG